MDDVEAARAQTHVERGNVDADLVALEHLAEQRFICPGGTLFTADLDHQRVLAGDDATGQLQSTAHPVSPPAWATMPWQTSSIASRLRAATLSSAVWLASVPLASRMQSKPPPISALASLPPPVEVRCGSKPARRKPASGSARARQSVGIR